MNPHTKLPRMCDYFIMARISRTWLQWNYFGSSRFSCVLVQTLKLHLMLSVPYHYCRLLLPNIWKNLPSNLFNHTVSPHFTYLLCRSISSVCVGWWIPWWQDIWIHSSPEKGRLDIHPQTQSLRTCFPVRFMTLCSNFCSWLRNSPSTWSGKKSNIQQGPNRTTVVTNRVSKSWINQWNTNNLLSTSYWRNFFQMWEFKND